MGIIDKVKAIYLIQKNKTEVGGLGGAPAGVNNPSHQGQRAGRARAGPQGLLLTRIGCPSPLTDKSRDLRAPGVDSHHKIDEPVHVRLLGW